MKETIILVLSLLLKLGGAQQAAVFGAGPGSSYAAYASPGAVSAVSVSRGGGGGFPPGFPFNGGGGQLPQNFRGAAERPPVIFPMVFEYGELAPDNYVQKGITINKQFPGPLIRVVWMDTLIVDVTNKLDHPIALHFHGLRNYGDSYFDGVPYTTQEPIPVGGVFRYVIKIGLQTGTFMYHLQSSLADQIWAFGPIIIEDGPELLVNHKEYYHYWDEVIILSQNWHIPFEDILKLEGQQNVGKSRYLKEFPAEPNSLLINGKSYGEWENENGFSEGYSVINVKKGKVYRIRVIGAGVNSLMTFSIEKHNMSIIEVDGTIIVPLEVDRLEVNSGQRYSILVKMDQEVDTYLVSSEMIPGPGPLNGQGILKYEGASLDEGKRKKIYKGKSTPEVLSRWEGSKLAPNPEIKQPDIYPVPETVNKEIVIRTVRRKVKKDEEDSSEDDDTESVTEKSVSETETKYSYKVNNKSFKNPKTPYLIQLRSNGVNITKEPQVFETLTNQSLQIIFQNAASDSGICVQHAWHIHGHSFYVVGHGKGTYDEEKAGPKIKEKVATSPLVFRDVVTSYPEPEVEGKELDKLQPAEDCGWTAVRLLTDNPGVWLVHCHLATHLAAGEEFIIYSHTRDNPRLYPGGRG